jgi:hypothetical protein
MKPTFPIAEKTTAASPFNWRLLLFAALAAFGGWPGHNFIVWF